MDAGGEEGGERGAVGHGSVDGARVKVVLH